MFHVVPRDCAACHNMKHNSMGSRNCSAAGAFPLKRGRFFAQYEFQEFSVCWGGYTTPTNQNLLKPIKSLDLLLEQF